MTIEVQTLFQEKDGPPKLAFMHQPVIDMSVNQKLIVCACEAGLVSGGVSVLIASSSPGGSVVMQTSLEQLIISVEHMKVQAGLRWGWHMGQEPGEEG